MVIRVLGERQILLLGIQEKEQVAVLEHQQQKELEDFIYRTAFLLADVGFLQEPTYSEFYVSPCQLILLVWEYDFLNL